MNSNVEYNGLYTKVFSNIEINLIALSFVKGYFSSGTFFQNSMVETPLCLNSFNLSSFCSSSSSNSTAAVFFVIGDRTRQSSPTTSTAKRFSRNENDDLSDLKS